MSYGGGAFLSVVIVLILITSILLSINDYKSDQLDDFRKAKLALDSAFVQRDAGYVRTLNMIEYAWQNKSSELIAEGDKELPGFIEHDNEAIIKASDGGVPWLVMADGIDAWPKEKIDRYLGLVRELSVINGTSLTIRGNRPITVTSFYDPDEVLFAFGNRLGEAGFKPVQKSGNKSALFTKSVVPDIDFSNSQQLQDLHKGNPILPFYGEGLPKVASSLTVNPLTGAPAIAGTMVAMDGDTPIGAFVAYEPIEPFVNQLRAISDQELAVVTDDGKVVFGSGSEAANQAIAASMKPLLVVQPNADRTAVYHIGGRFYIARRLAGTDWTLVHAYSWSDVLHGKRIPILVAMALAALLLATLWLLLIRQYQTVFAPAMSRAKRVYQSEELNRTVIETSPVGLCVIATKDASPLLQNDIVRSYAAAMSDPGAAFYKQLLRDFAKAKDTLNDRPEAREFGFTLSETEKGGARHLLVAALPIVYQNRPALFCVLRDVTARIELEENLLRARHDSEQAKLAAESASRAKTSFVATMSHEIRTPLNGILGHLELLARSHLEPSQRERLGRIRLSADALLGIISDILDFSRIEAGQLDIDPVPFELRPLIEQTALLYAPAAQRKGLKLYYSVEAGLAESYVADAHRIRQILNNLVSNAVKFTESGRVVLRVRSVPLHGSDSARLRFEVIDSGIGMTEEQRKQIFQPFSQADASISRRFGGSGLGLALCQELGELMGGLIEVQSTLSVGSVFSFELPLTVDEFVQPAGAAPLAGSRIALLSLAAEWRAEIEGLLSGWGAEVMVAALPSELDADWVRQADALVIFGAGQAWSADEEDVLLAGARRIVKASMDGPLLPEWQDGLCLISCYSSPTLLAALQEPEPDIDLPIDEATYQHSENAVAERHGSVLLVDDNPVNRELIQQQLEILGYTVDAAEDGTTALRLWHEGRYDIVLTDINMPHMDGYELTEQLRARGARIPILAVTATALTSEKQHCKQSGINDLLLKPLSLEVLDEAMSRHLVQPARPPVAPVKAKWAGKYPEKVCRIFVESGTRDLQTILDAARVRDTETLLARVHSLKGALLMLGEHEAAAECLELEKRIGAEGIAAARAGVDQLEMTMRELLRRYAEYL
ncbi:hypothetical protein GCM10007863_41340 [Dyella mobilis]|nr:hypothetical protein GCM10007863_41340 [Dyella mobilis]